MIWRALGLHFWWFCLALFPWIQIANFCEISVLERSCSCTKNYYVHCCFDLGVRISDAASIEDTALSKEGRYLTVCMPSVSKIKSDITAV